MILALANPVPEIMPDIAKAARPDAVIATGDPTFPIRSTTCSASHSFSAEPLMSVPQKSTRR